MAEQKQSLLKEVSNFEEFDEEEAKSNFQALEYKDEPPAYDDASTSTVVTQPQPVPAGFVLVAREELPSNNNTIICSVLNIFCCCWIFGVVALVFAGESLLLITVRHLFM